MQFFIGPMSKNVVDTIIEYTNNHDVNITFIPSRRQIEYTKGYVNDWNTKSFVEYVNTKSYKKIIIERDHSGPGQGLNDDDGFESLLEDTKYIDVIHIDPWKKYPLFDEGLQWTIDMILFCYKHNPNIYYEIATEEGIRKFEVDELETLILELQKSLPSEVYKQIKYLVIQCGTKLTESKNIGNFNSEQLKDMITLCHKYNLIPKEHNGDWVSSEIILEKSHYGLSCINIAPEFGEIETKVLLKYFKQCGLFEDFYNICYESRKWEKWVSSSFIPDENKDHLVRICGHYVYSDPKFIILKNKLMNDFHIPIDDIICCDIRNKLDSLYNICKQY